MTYNGGRQTNSSLHVVLLPQGAAVYSAGPRRLNLFYLILFFNLLELDGRRPSALLAQMEPLNIAPGKSIPQELLRHLRLNLMPPEIRLHLAKLQDNLTLQEYAEKTDHLYDVYRHTSAEGLSRPLVGSGLDLLRATSPRVNPVSRQCSTVKDNCNSSAKFHSDDNRDILKTVL